MLAENVRVNVFGKVGKGFSPPMFQAIPFQTKALILLHARTELKNTLTVWLLPLPNLRDSRAINS